MTDIEKDKLKKQKKAKRAEDRAIRRLRFLLLRVWFFKNIFTLVIMFVVILMAFTVTGLIPETMPVLGTFSYAMKDSLQTFLEIGDDEFYSMFGSITGIFTLLWSIGYASSKMKRVSYHMLNKNKILKIVLANSNLSFDDKGRIVSIEKRIGVDLDGDNLIGDDPAKPKGDADNLVNEIVETFTELSTIINIDKETLKKTVDETSYKTTTDEVKETVAEAVVKKPAVPFRPNKF